MACLTFRVLLLSSLSTGCILNLSSLFIYYYFMSESCWAALICSQNVSRATDLNLAWVQIFLMQISAKQNIRHKKRTVLRCEGNTIKHCLWKQPAGMRRGYPHHSGYSLISQAIWETTLFIDIFYLRLQHPLWPTWWHYALSRGKELRQFV